MMGIQIALRIAKMMKTRQPIFAMAGGVICTITKVEIQFAKLETAPPRARMRVVEIWGRDACELGDISNVCMYGLPQQDIATAWKIPGRQYMNEI
jgi:hypothetical protein